MTDTAAKASELWLAIAAMKRPHRIVDFPRAGAGGKPVGQIAMVVLTQEEQILAAGAAERETRKVLKDVPKADDARRGYDDVYNNSAAVEVLFKSARQAENIDIPFFPTPHDIRQYLTTDEVAVLMSHYLTTQADLGPIASKMDKADIEAWIKRIGEAGTSFPLDLLSWEAVKTLAFSLALQAYSSMTSTTSPGSPPDDGTESSPQEPMGALAE